jgi:hypothetical protein
MVPRSPAEVARWVQVGVAGRALKGEAESGDCELVCGFDRGVLLGVFDGLGHGGEAAEAARRARAVCERQPGGSVISLVKACHGELIGTRGVAMSLASLDVREATVTWVGVGNVEGLLWQRDGSGRVTRSGLVIRGGVVGAQLPALRAEVVTVAAGDTLAFATDGIGREFAEHVALNRAPQDLADRILLDFGRANDDALVLVVRLLLQG